MLEHVVGTCTEHVTCDDDGGCEREGAEGNGLYTATIAIKGGMNRYR